MLWRRGGDIVSVGNHVTARDSRLEVEPGESGNHLVVRGAELADQGGYSCSVSAYKETLQKHQLLCFIKLYEMNLWKRHEASAGC